MHLLSDICIISNLHRTGFVLLKTWSIFLCWLLVLWNVWLGLQSSRLQYCCWHSLELCLCSNDVAAESLRARYVSVGNIKFFFNSVKSVQKMPFVDDINQHPRVSIWIWDQCDWYLLLITPSWWILPYDQVFLCYYPAFIFLGFLSFFQHEVVVNVYWILFYMNLLKFSTCVCCL